MTTNLYHRYEWMSTQLEREAYAKQMEGRTKPLKHFYPCEKALCFTRAMREIMRENPEGFVTSVVIPTASRTLCSCHPGLSESDLWKLFDAAIDAIPATNPTN